MSHQAVALPPSGRGGAYALTLAAVHAVTADDPVLLAAPPAFAADSEALERGLALAARGALAVYALPASSPEPGRAWLSAPNGYVEEFVADADAARALACFQSGFLCAAGAFAVRASAWIDAVGCLRPDLLRACERRTPAAYPESIEQAVIARLAETGLEAAVVLLDTALRKAA